ncbi:TetR/AcrR family transcriptional regulator [Rhodococcus sp. NPDC057297]|uniref:TetR/AcrR family transcriptional regulator n=1 Tax=Rhodococcus sp. NPDC057297 TaxID=3346090 RepID=UPI003628D1F1
MATNTSSAASSDHASALSQPTTEPRTARGRKTRERLLTAARIVFETKGFLDTRVSDICGEASLAQGTFYIYFQTKEDIFYNLVDSVVADRYLLTSVPDDFDGTVADRFAYTLRQYFIEVQRAKKFSRIVEQVATFDEHMRESRMKIRREFSRRIQHGIERLQRQSAADQDISAELTAEAIVAMINNFAYINLVLGERDDLDIDQVVSTLTNIWARSIALDVEKATANEANRTFNTKAN